MANVTASQAAKLAGVTRATIHKALNSGRLSGAKDEAGVYQIDVAELQRAFPPKSKVDVTGDTIESKADTGEVTALQRENQLLRDQLQDVKTDRDKWQEQAARVSLLLTDQRQQPEPKKTWWQRLIA